MRAYMQNSICMTFPGILVINPRPFCSRTNAVFPNSFYMLYR